MASIQQTTSAGNSPAFRTRGLSFVLVCVLLTNLLLVVVAPTLRPERAAAQDAGPAVTEKVAITTKVNATRQPEKAQLVDVESQAEHVGESGPSQSTKAISTPRLAQSELQEQSGETPPEVTVIEPPKVNGQESVAELENPANSSATNVEGSESQNEAVARADSQSNTLLEQPAAEMQPEAAMLVPVASPKLLVVNPAGSGGTVFYLVDGDVHSLAPGETEDLEEGRDHKIEFHRGQNFGDAEVMVNTGTFHFRVGDNGWDLAEASREDI